MGTLFNVIVVNLPVIIGLAKHRVYNFSIYDEFKNVQVCRVDSELYLDLTLLNEVTRVSYREINIDIGHS